MFSFLLFLAMMQTGTAPTCQQARKTSESSIRTDIPGKETPSASETVEQAGSKSQTGTAQCPPSYKCSPLATGQGVIQVPVVADRDKPCVPPTGVFYQRWMERFCTADQRAAIKCVGTAEEWLHVCDAKVPVAEGWQMPHGPITKGNETTSCCDCEDFHTCKKTPVAEGAETLAPQTGGAQPLTQHNVTELYRGTDGMYRISIQGGDFVILDTTAQPESVDVPAIQKKRKACLRQSNIIVAIPSAQPACEEWGTEKYWTCADPHRILEHTEAGEYYCRKVQP